MHQWFRIVVEGQDDKTLSDTNSGNAVSPEVTNHKTQNIRWNLQYQKKRQCKTSVLLITITNNTLKKYKHGS